METLVNEQVNEEVITPIEEEVVLPSDVVPDEYEGLTREELLAKLKEGKEPPKEEVVVEVPTDIVTEFSDRFNKNEGAFTEQDYTDLQAKGYSKEFVDTYVEGVKAKELAATEAILAPYGTMEEYASALVYASSNWSEAQVLQYNNALSKADTDTTSILVASLMKEYKGSNKIDNPNAPITQTKPPVVQSIKGYETKSDMVKDMGDKRYGRDASYTKKVEDKMGITDMKNWYANVRRGD